MNRGAACSCVLSSCGFFFISAAYYDAAKASVCCWCWNNNRTFLLIIIAAHSTALMECGAMRDTNLQGLLGLLLPAEEGYWQVITCAEILSQIKPKNAVWSHGRLCFQTKQWVQIGTYRVFWSCLPHWLQQTKCKWYLLRVRIIPRDADSGYV